jgi:hypothetical protein
MEGTVDFRPGLRISRADVGVLLLGVMVSSAWARIDEALAIAALFTLAPFFSFCNVLRMGRPLELVWAVVFVLFCASTIRTGRPPWGYTLCVMLAVTVILAVAQVLQPSYHGVFWRQRNPNLSQRWAANRKAQV